MYIIVIYEHTKQPFQERNVHSLSWVYQLSAYQSFRILRDDGTSIGVK